jgi:tRNA dimethylallyltransferase
MASFREKPKIIVLCGPTAIGKTAAAIDLAQKINGEIISADSVQIYRYMDIGTAKPTLSERQAVPHHMIDIVNPDDPFDAALFAQRVGPVIADLTQKGKVPIVAGGTGFYIKALIQGLFTADPIDATTRMRLKKEAETLGMGKLYLRLCAIDPETAAVVHEKDTYRILRALEVYEATGVPISAARKAHGFSGKSFHVLKIGLGMDRQELYRRIDTRVDLMMDQGLVGEVQGLLEKGYGRNLKSMQTIGYRHVICLLHGEMNREQTLETLKRDTRRYAKRQLTWFGKDPAIHWMAPEDTHGMGKSARAFLQATPD